MINPKSKTLNPKQTQNTKPKKRTVFSDFDNTITMNDVLDDIIMRFSPDKGWEDLEEKWKAGRIGSRECLEGQIGGVRIDKEALDRYLSGVEIDPYFKKLVELLNKKNIEMMILSDNFEYIIKKILEHNGFGDLKVYSNRLNIEKDRLIPEFPFGDKDCKTCAHCKKSNMTAHVDPSAKASLDRARDGSSRDGEPVEPQGQSRAGRGIDNDEHMTYYIGDGRSDTCPSRHASVIFAKDYLKEYCKKEGIEYIPFTDLKEVCEYFKREIR